MTDSILLNVGCGPITEIDRIPPFFRGQGWAEIRLDIDPAAAPDILASITDLSSLEPGSVDAIWSSHNLEHLYDHEVGKALREFLRILKPDGFLYLKVPDLQAIAEVIVTGGLDQAAYQSPAGPIAPIDMIYGHRPALAAGNLFMAHHTGFTPQILQRVLAEAGFGYGVMKRQAYLELSALVFKGNPEEERRSQVLAGLAF